MRSRSPSPTHRKKSKKDKSYKDERSDIPEEISDEDYYRKNSEFRLWLIESKDKYFDELDKDKQRKYFQKFVDKWNSGSLKSKFYEGVRSSQISRNDSTRHKWKFSKKLDENEMDVIRDSVDSATYSKQSTKPMSSFNSSRRIIGPSFPSNTGSGASGFELEVDQEDYRRQQNLDRKREEKAFRKDRELVMEELVPKATGREAMIEKRREKAAYTRREKSPDVVLNDSELLGNDDFQSALAREKAREAKRNDRRQNFLQEKASELKDRAAQYRAKEEATLEMFRKMAAARQQQPPPS